MLSMIKNSMLFVMSMLVVSCGTNRTVIQTTKSGRTSSSTAVVRKPITTKASENVPVKVTGINNPKTEILEATTRVKVTTEMVLAYIDRFKEISKNNMTQFGIPSSIILAQGILESGAGTGPLSVEANNHFGIKCHKDWTGPSIKHDDDTEQECFRKYGQASESFKDHALFLMNRPWYAGLFKLNKGDYKAWAKGLKAAGYATDPKYPDKLIGIIERYQLNQYDAQVLGTDFVPVIAVVSPSEVTATDLKGYRVTQGDTLYSISKKFNLTVDELRRKNNMADNAISIGQNLLVE
jgi:flagellum-specific peptidoglycan hydrolase FlgJ